MEFKDTTWKTAAKMSAVLITFTLIYSLFVTYLNLFSIFTQVLGVILFIILLYKLVSKIHKTEQTRQKTGYCFFVVLFSFLLNFVLVLAISLINTAFGIV